MVLLGARVAAARLRLRDAGIPPDEADLDARVLAEHVLGWDAARFLTSSSEPEPPDFAARFDALVERRAVREPLAYITGTREFWGLSFEVSPAVLVPRRETELIVETALARFPDPGAPLHLADVCTGSGCLAVALASERPHATLVATDISAAALEIARRNARRHSVADRIRFVRTDLLGGLDDRFDLIVCNPPYVPERDRASLEPEVRNHEPALALFAGENGLAVLPRVVAQAAARLKPAGLLLFEFGFGQADAVEGLIRGTARLTMVALANDLQGIPRTAVVRRDVMP